jgi:hypothetical protein
MMVLLRPFRVLHLAIAFSALSCLAFAPVLNHSDAIAKLRPEIQVGDPTDTDPGPAPTPPKGTTKTLSAQFESHGATYSSRSFRNARSALRSINWWALAVLLSRRL